MRSGKDASDALAEGRPRPPYSQSRKAAKANAFDAGNLEKLLRLRELLNEFQKHPFLRTHGHTLTS